ncbi:MAG: DUF1554 domain-containing protein [Deltaproteobacteria bacterium]|nr:DUF1554 domain-containing protein [Deltaproteobacteria bacterium]
MGPKLKTSIEIFLSIFILATVRFACSYPETRVETMGTETIVMEGTVTKEIAENQGELIIETTLDDQISSVKIASQTFLAKSIITLQEGDSLIDNDSDVGSLIISSVFSSSPTLLISSSREENPANPIEVKLPIPAEAFRSFALESVIEDPLDHLIVVYKVIDYKGSNIIKVGFIPRANLEIEDTLVKFKTSLLGAFQAVITADLLTVSLERIAKTSILNKKGEVIIENTLAERGLPDEVFSTNASPQELKEFTVSQESDAQQGEIRLSIKLGDYYDVAYDRLAIRRIAGTTSPNADCESDGEPIAEWDSFPISSFSYIDQTGSTVGEAFSYRACIYGKNSVLTSTNTIRNQIAFDRINPPAASSFSVATGRLQGELVFSVEWASDRSDYARAQIRGLKGTSAPSASCNGSSDTVVATVSVFSSSTYSISHITGSTTGETFSYRLCIWDRGNNLTASNTVSAETPAGGGGGSGGSGTPSDTQAPPALTSFSAATGTSVGAIELSWAYPSVTSDYAKLSVRALAGTSPPNADCSSNGTEISSVTSPFSTTTYSYATGTTDGSQYSFRACITDSSSNLTSSNTVSGVSAKIAPTPGALAAFSANTGTATDGDIDLSLTWPADVSSYSQAKIRRLTGSTAPNADCSSNGTVVKTYTSFTANGSATFTDATGSTTGELFSYRVCITSTYGVLQSSNATSAAVRARDAQAPPNLSSFTAPGGESSHGEIKLSLTYPGSVADYATVEIWRLQSASAPSSACSTADGSAMITSYTSFTASSVVNYTDTPSTANPPAGPYSYRVCIKDSSGNLTANNADTVTNKTPKDLTAPPGLDGFTVVAGASNLGQFSITLNVSDGNTSDYSSLTVRRMSGASAPNSDCTSDGSAITVANATSFVDKTFSNYGTPNTAYSFRVCISDAQGNTTNTATSLNVTPKSNTNHRIFVKSTTVSNGNLGGLSAADVLCQTAADAVTSLGGIWKAVMSSSLQNANSRITLVSGVNVNNMNSQTVKSTATFWDGSNLTNKIDYNENSIQVTTDVNVWTGTSATGTHTGTSCSDWTSTAGTGTFGASDTANKAFSSSTSACTTSTHRIYCIDGQ